MLYNTGLNCHSREACLCMQANDSTENVSFKICEHPPYYIVELRNILLRTLEVVMRYAKQILLSFFNWKYVCIRKSLKCWKLIRKCSHCWKIASTVNISLKCGGILSRLLQAGDFYVKVYIFLTLQILEGLSPCSDRCLSITSKISNCCPLQQITSDSSKSEYKILYWFLLKLRLSIRRESCAGQGKSKRSHTTSIFSL